MNNFNFGEVLTRAWQIIWKHKVLWIFGILASCARGSGGSSGGGGNSGYRTGSGDTPFSTGQFEQFMSQVGNFLEKNWWIILAVIVGLLLLSLIFYFLGMMGRIGLIKGTALADKGAEHLAFGELWSESMPFFWRVFGINFIFGLVFFVILVPFILFGVFTAGIGFLCLLPILCLMIPLSWVVMVIIKQAQNAIVLEDLSMLDGFKRGWEIVKANAVTMVVMLLILGIGSAVIGVIVALPILIVVTLAFLNMASFLEGNIISWQPFILPAVLILLYLPIAWFFRGVLLTYTETSWTLTYLRLAKQKEEAPVIIEANA